MCAMCPVAEVPCGVCCPPRARLEELMQIYKYQGEETCAADGMCQVKCPVKINTGELIKSIRAEELGTATRASKIASVRTPVLPFLAHCWCISDASRTCHVVAQRSVTTLRLRNKQP